MSDNKAHPVRQISGSLLGLLVLLVAVIAANVIVKNLRLRVDLTDEKRYSLSEGSANTMAKLEQNVELQFYFSRSNPKVPMQLKAFAEQTEDFLREYVRASKGKIRLTVIDPKPDTDEEDQAAQFGLQGVPVDMYGGPMYMGLVVLSGKRTVTMPIVDPQNQSFFEYEVSRMIYQATHPQKRVVGVLSSLPVLGSSPPQQFMMPGQPQPQQQPAWFTFSELQKDSELRDVSAVEAEQGIPSDVSTLIVVHPKDLSEKSIYAIDQFVLRGGHLIAFVDPSAYSDTTAAPSPYGGPTRAASDLDVLFKAWGVGYDSERVIVDKDSGMQVLEGDRVVLNHAVLLYNAANVSKDDRATVNLTSVRAVFAGALTDKTDDAITVVPLISASSNSGTVPAMTARFGSDAMKRDYRPAATPQHLALKLTGTFKTAFPEGAPTVPSPDGEEPPPSTDSAPLTQGESTVVIVSDVDMLADITNIEEIRSPFGLLKQPISNNGVLLANLVDQLGGNQDLISIRSRAQADRSFTYVEKLRKKAQNAFEETMAQLQQQAQEAERRINELQRQKSDSQRQFISDEQRDTIAKFQAQKRDINHKIRQVQKDLRREIDTLGSWITIANIALMPLLVVGIGVIVAIRKSQR